MPIGTDTPDHQRLFELAVLPAVLLHELSHAVVYRSFGVEYELKLAYADDVGRSRVLTHSPLTDRVQVLACLAPYVLVVPAVLVTALLGRTVDSGTTVGTVLSVLLFAQGFGIALCAAPSKPDITAAFAELGVFDGDRWWFAVATNEAVRLGVVLLWLSVTFDYVLGRGWTIPSGRRSLVIVGVAVLALCVHASDGDADDRCRKEVELRLRHAASLAERGRDEAADRGFRRAIADAEDRGVDAPTLYASYGGYLVDRWRIATAERYCRRAVESDPDCPLAHVNYAAVLALRDRYGDAERHCRRALELLSGSEPTEAAVYAHVNYAAVLLERERYDEARDHCQRALELDPDEPRAHVGYARLLAERGAVDDAERRFERALELDPDDPVVRTEYADYLADRGGDAERQYRRALECDPDCVPALEEYAAFLEARGRTAEADRLAERAAAIGGDGTAS